MASNSNSTHQMCSNHTGFPSKDRTKQYLLGRDHSASVRLNCQALLWHHELDFIVHPSLPALKPSSRVADLGTGTAIWLLQLAREPNTPAGVSFHGFDIDLAQAPPSSLLPSNFKLSKLDVFQPVTSLEPELLGSFDIVHIRLLLFVVQNNDPAPVLRTAMALLKPGGWLQWDELDVSSAFILHAGNGTQSSDFSTSESGERFRKAQLRLDASTLQWSQELIDHTIKQGFKQATEYRGFGGKDRSPAMAKFFQDTYLMVLQELAVNIEAEEDAKIWDDIEFVMQEAAKGAAIVLPKRVIVGRNDL